MNSTTASARNWSKTALSVACSGSRTNAVHAAMIASHKLDRACECSQGSVVSSGRYIDVCRCSPQYVIFKLLKKNTAPIAPVKQGPNSIRTRDVPGLHCAEIGGRSAG